MQAESLDWLEIASDVVVAWEHACEVPILNMATSTALTQRIAQALESAYERGQTFESESPSA